ncbi:hypothetical protein ACHAXS_011410 [Conticribra weissflogii]
MNPERDQSSSTSSSSSLPALAPPFLAESCKINDHNHRFEKQSSNGDDSNENVITAISSSINNPNASKRPMPPLPENSRVLKQTRPDDSSSASRCENHSASSSVASSDALSAGPTIATKDCSTAEASNATEELPNIHPNDSFFDRLCDDTLMRIVSFVDLPSLVFFARGTCRSLNSRFRSPRSGFHDASGYCDNGNDFDEIYDSESNDQRDLIMTLDRSSESQCHQLWKMIFARHNFSPPTEPHRNGTTTAFSISCPTDEDYYNELRLRLALFANLTGRKRQKRSSITKLMNSLGTPTSRSRTSSSSQRIPTAVPSFTKYQCFSLPHRYFYFVPVVPPDMMQFASENGDNGTAAVSYRLLGEDYDNDDREDNNEEDSDQINFDFEFDNDENDEHGRREDRVLDDHEFQDLNRRNHTGVDMDMDMDMEPPPVEFTCDSYSLTSPSTGGEFVLLNPFSGSIEVYESILDNAIGSEESMLEKALLDASRGILRKRGRLTGGDGCRIVDHGNDVHLNEHDIPDENSEDIAGEAIHHHITHHSHRNIYDTPPNQVLFSVNNYFDLDLEEYFGEYTPFGKEVERGYWRRNGNVTVDWVGVDTHVALGGVAGGDSGDWDDCRLVGNVIGAGRILTMENSEGGGGGSSSAELECMEVFAWSNFRAQSVLDGDLDASTPPYSKYTDEFICRAAGSPYYLDICANYMKLYASFEAGSVPFSDNGLVENREHLRDDDNRSNHNMQLMDIDDESVVGENGEPIQLSKTIFRLPFIQHDKDTPSSPEIIRSYFPAPEAHFTAQYPVSSFIIDPTGKILFVGTEKGTIELWHTGMNGNNNPSPPRILQRLSVRQSFLKRARSRTMDERQDRSSGTVSTNDDDANPKPIDDNMIAADLGVEDSAQDDLALLSSNTQRSVPHKHPTSKISSIYLSSHRPVHQCGFVTKQRNREFGTTLLLWQLPTISCDASPDISNERFQIMAMINLPFSVQCHPEVHYDGRRLIVFGKDHIGLIILVYHILSTRFDQKEFQDSQEPSTRPRRLKCGGRSSSRGGGGDDSGGIVHLNLNGEHRIKFVNRIRHAGLGGLEYYDYMSLTANERFLVVNT